MKITSIGVQARDENRVNISVDGKYLFSLDIAQLSDLKIKVGDQFSSEEIEELITESQYGKVYSRALEYCLARPHSQKELRDYLYKKTYDKKLATGKVVKGISKENMQRVIDKLIDKGYIDDEKFALYWVENRNQRKGISKRKLIYELKAKGVAEDLIGRALSRSERSDNYEIKKIIEKKKSKYLDRNKFISYLSRQGFSYDDIVKSLDELEIASD